MKNKIKSYFLIMGIVFVAFLGIDTVYATWSAEMTPKAIIVEVGKTEKVIAIQTGSSQVNTLPTYTSSDESIAIVDVDGNVRGVKTGTATITGKFGDLVAGTTTVTVTASKIRWLGEMTPKTATIQVGETTKVTARETGDTRINTLPTYTSSDESIAIVDNNGNVVGINVGAATITGKFGNFVAGTTTVTVTANNSWAGEMTPKTATIQVGEMTKVTAIQTGSSQVNTLPTYTSSDESIAIVDVDGNVRGIKAGIATITGKFGNFVAGTATVTVTANNSWSGKMTPKAVTIQVGETTKVTAIQTGSTRVNTLPTYISSDESIAIVDVNGNVRGIKAGIATITGKFGDLVAGVTAVTIIEYNSENLMIKSDSTYIQVGETAKVTVQHNDNIANSDITYYSNDTSIATVDENGNIIAINPGTVTISAKVDGKDINNDVYLTILDKEKNDNGVNNVNNKTVKYVLVGGIVCLIVCVALFVKNKIVSKN